MADRALAGKAHDGYDITVVGAVYLFADGDPLVRATDVDFELAVGVGVLIVVVFHLIGSFQVAGIRPESLIHQNRKRRQGDPPLP